MLSRTLAERLSLPHIELDPIRQAHANDAEFIRRVKALTAGPAWIVDGHYRLVREDIWQRAETIVWLNYPLGLVLFRLLGRFAGKFGVASRDARTGKGEAAVSSPPASWARRFGRLARTVRERREYRELLAAAARRGAALVELRSDSETRAWLRSLDRAESRSQGQPTC